MNEFVASLDRAGTFSRRRLFGLGAAACGSAALGPTLTSSPTPQAAQRNGRIKHSLVYWCFQKYWQPKEMAQIAVRLGCSSIELIDPKHWPTLKQHGLTTAIASVPISPGPAFMRGFNNPRYQGQAIEATSKMIDLCADFGCPSVISFTGFTQRNLDDLASGHLSPDEGIKNCVAGYKQIIAHAERKGINICLEMLNTRDDSHPMKGHPGYQGDHTDYCLEIIRQVGSPRMKLLFDVYHVQIMDGDVIRRIRQTKEFIGHVHTAGNPGRGELDDRQEIQYKPIMQALVETGYTGHVGHEFIPTRDPLDGLTEAVAVCDV